MVRTIYSSAPSMCRIVNYYLQLASGGVADWQDQATCSHFRFYWYYSDMKILLSICEIEVRHLKKTKKQQFWILIPIYFTVVLWKKIEVLMITMGWLLKKNAFYFVKWFVIEIHPKYDLLKRSGFSVFSLSLKWEMLHKKDYRNYDINISI